MAVTDYNIDFNKLAKDLLGAFDAKARRVAWLTAIAAGLKSVHARFKTYTDAKVDEAKYNGQTFVLEQFLIAKYGSGIYITNNLESISGFFVGSGNDVTSFIGTGGDIQNYIDIDYNVSPYKFTVHVPSAITFVQSEMEAYIRKYRFIGEPNFNIVIV